MGAMELMVLLAALALWDRPAPREPLEQPALMVLLVWMVLTGKMVLLVPLALLAHRGAMEQTELTVPLVPLDLPGPMVHRDVMAPLDLPGPMAHQRYSERNP
jgi:hypothetical protein